MFTLLGIGHLLPALHFSLVAHELCAEHGELYHQLEHDSGKASVASSPRMGDVSVVASVNAEHEHEHCGVLALPGSAGLPASATPVLRIAPMAGATSAPGGARTAHVGIELLSYAPKLAPPV